MADVQPLRAIHYDPAVAGTLSDLVAPPYDVIDDSRRAELAARSPNNVVAVDLPVGEDPYAEAARVWQRWRDEGVVVEDSSEALWPLEQEYRAPDGRRLRRRGFLCRVRIEEYGAGRIRPHERTHPGPKEDRLRLTRATRTNLSPIFALYSDPLGAAWSALEAARSEEPFDEVHDDEGTTHTLWRVADVAAISAIREVLSEAELLIADGHHRYETARAYADETGGEGAHRYVLVCLVALEDPGLLVFPTHRLVRGLQADQHEALATVLRRDFEIAEVARLFPEALDYVDVYDRAGGLGERTMLAHAVHLSDRELSRLVESGSHVAHCPASNLFLASGVMPLGRYLEAGLSVGLGSDVAGGPDLSIFTAMRVGFYAQNALRVAARLSGPALGPLDWLRMGTLGGAKALGMGDQTGSLETGKEADLIVLDPSFVATVPGAADDDPEDLMSRVIFRSHPDMVRAAWVRGRQLDGPGQHG